jgi:hypothetical protein
MLDYVALSVFGFRRCGLPHRHSHLGEAALASLGLRRQTLDIWRQTAIVVFAGSGLRPVRGTWESERCGDHDSDTRTAKEQAELPLRNKESN